MADLILYTGPMFSSKTTKLLMQADKRFYQKQKVIAFKSRMDDRYSAVGEIVTHNFNKIPAHLVDTGEEIIQKIANQDSVDCVLIDELFLIEGGAETCIKLYKLGYDVVVASIDLSFTGEAFPEVEKLMPYCTRIVKCKSVCSVCQKDARYTFKLSQDNPETQIEVGGAELYEPRCQEHHNYMRS